MKSFGDLLVVRFSILLFVSSFAVAATSQPKSAVPAPKSVQKTSSKKTSSPAKPGKHAKPDKSRELYFVDTISLPVSDEHVGRLSAEEVIPLLGNIDPYALKNRDSDTLILYRTTKDGTPAADSAEIQKLAEEVAKLAPGHVTVEVIPVPHGASLDNMLKTIRGLIPDSNIIVTADGRDRVRVVRGSGVAEADYDQFKRDIERIGWQIKNESPVSRVFYVNAADVSATVGGQRGSKGGGSDSSGSGRTQKDSTPSPAITQAKSAPKANATADAKGDSNSDSTDGGDDSAQSLNQGSAKGEPGDDNREASSSSPSVSVTSVNDDLLVFNATGGHDADITEKKRVLANLDFPRPEVLLNIWSFQASSSRMEDVAAHARGVRRTIGAFNNLIQQRIDNTWNDLQASVSSRNGFNTQLYEYLTKQYVGDYVSPYQRGDSLYLPPNRRADLGICEAGSYCLGYSFLFRPTKPTWTDLLLAIIVSSQPGSQMRKAIELMQGSAQSKSAFRVDSEHPDLTCEAADRYEIVSHAKWLKDLAESDDKKDLDQLIKDAQANLGDLLLPLHCFQTQAYREFGDETSDKAGGAPRVRLLRATLANFLFHYKMSQQYPHEFSPYDLNQSAEELNSELNPLIVAFNRDISALLDVFSQLENQTETRNSWWGYGGHGASFINNGVITVRTISGKSTTVDAVTQSIFDATNPPSITDLINSVGKAESNVPNVLKANLTAHEAATIIGALNSVTPAQSKIGREFKINITPRSLSGASASELQVSLDAKESAEPTLYSNGNSSSDNISRVADHSVDTKVRLESIKLFEVSSFSAYLERSRRNVPIVPPFFELPYVGSILSLPLRGAKEYHRSTAVISAIVVPTSIDIVSGIRFNFDRVIAPSELNATKGPKCSKTENGTDDETSCMLRVALSTSDLSPIPITAYHRAKLACIATGAENPFPGSSLRCNDLKLSDFYPER